mmetsp:Transcript_2360/g.5543  ORF Transcript_2360/g.5543 Transcript_2360/m.5543 type:complete len:216 (-) Transcript_2360:1024-1671(-)
MVSENLHGGLGIGVIRGLEPQLGDADFFEERFDCADQMAQGQVPVRHQPLHLVELAQVCCIHGLVSEHPVDGEVLLRGEGARGLVLLSQRVQHLCGDGGGVRPQQVLHRLFSLEHAPIPDGAAVPTILVCLLHPLIVGGRGVPSSCRTLHEERVVRVSGGVRLWLEKSVEVPEGAFYPLGGGHLLEPHLHQNAPKFGPDLEQGVEITPHCGGAHG